VAAFVVWAILVGFFLGWLRLKSRSVFPAALRHGAINAYIGFGLLFAPATDETMTILLCVPGILELLAMAGLAYVDLSRARGYEGALPRHDQAVLRLAQGC
jgi:membrane protease YdiL (CAAX protease family)